MEVSRVPAAPSPSHCRPLRSLIGVWAGSEVTQRGVGSLLQAVLEQQQQEEEEEEEEEEESLRGDQQEDEEEEGQ